VGKFVMYYLYTNPSLRASGMDSFDEINVTEFRDMTNKENPDIVCVC
jgi:hypothetical protein